MKYVEIADTALRFIRSTPRLLNWLVISTVILICAKVFVFEKIEEPIVGLHSIGRMFDGLLTSILASYIFYLIVVHWKQFIERELLRPHLKKWTELVVGQCRGLLDSLHRETGIQLHFDDLTEEMINSAFKEIDLNAKAPLIKGIANGSFINANWNEFLYYYRVRTQHFLDRIYSNLPWVDAELAAICNEIDDSFYFIQLDSMRSDQIRNKDATFLSKMFFRYYRDCRRLNEWTNLKLAT